MSVTTISTKINKKNLESNLKSRKFVDRPGTAMLNALTSSLALTGSLRSVPHTRIGSKVERTNIGVNVVVNDSTIGGVKVGSITILSNPNDYEVDSFRFGKDVKTLGHLLSNKLSVNVSLADSLDFEEKIVNNTYIQTTFGQNSLFSTYDNIKDRFIPFEDFEGKPVAKSFIGLTDLKKSGFPYVYDDKKRFDKFRDPDEASLDGAVEVFPVRNSPANTGFIDLQIKGARGLFGVGNWELTQHTTYGKKGSPLMSERYEIKQSTYDYFEDATEAMVSKSVEGFISEGLYKSAPFVEKINYHDNQYRHLSKTQKSTLLISSSRDDCEIGTRFKSRDNGFIMVPFYETAEKRSLGTDSLAFSGLLKR